MPGVPDEIFDPDDYLHFYEEVPASRRSMRSTSEASPTAPAPAAS